MQTTSEELSGPNNEFNTGNLKQPIINVMIQPLDIGREDSYTTPQPPSEVWGDHSSTHRSGATDCSLVPRLSGRNDSCPVEVSSQCHPVRAGEMPRAKDDSLHFVKSSMEIVIEVLKLNDGLLERVQEERTLLELLSCGRKKKMRFKCKLFEVTTYVDLLKGYVSSWNSIWEQRQQLTTGYHGPPYDYKMISSLKSTLLHSLYTFVIYLEEIIYSGLMLLAHQGIHEISVSQLQKAIVGIVNYNSFLENLDAYLQRNARTPNSVIAKRGFNRLPEPIGITKILEIMSSVRAGAFSKVFVSLMVENIERDVDSFSSLKLNSNDWRECLALAGHFHPERNPLSLGPGLNPGNSACEGQFSQNSGKLDLLVGNSFAVPEPSRCDSLVTEMHTLYSQDDLNIRKLASVIHLSFMDVQDPKCTQQRNSPFPYKNQKAPFADFDCGSQQDKGFPNFMKIYKNELEKAFLNDLKQLLESPISQADVWHSEFPIGNLLLSSPQHIIKLGKCASELSVSLEKHVPLTNAFNSFKSHCYSLAAMKSWDVNFCSALAAMSSPKDVATLMSSGGFGTNAGKCVIDCLEPIIGLEVLANTTSGFDISIIQKETYPRLLATLEAVSLWLEAKLPGALNLWHLKTFCLITHGDLKMIIDLLKYAVNISPVQKSSCGSYVSSSFLTCRETAIRYLNLWEEIEKASARIQNCSSGSMKDFCKACERKAREELERHMPGRKTWRQRPKNKGFPTECSPYARVVVNEVMTPIVRGVEVFPTPVQISMISMATKVFSETWMNHILSSQIKFSLNGAQLLRLDFNYLLEFLRSQLSLSTEARQSVQALEILRHLKGIAALLLRQNETPWTNLGRRSRKVVPLCDLSEVDRQDESPQTESLDGNDVTSDSLTDEDYVLDKEVWLALRLNQPKSFSRTPFWCFS